MSSNLGRKNQKKVSSISLSSGRQGIKYQPACRQGLPPSVPLVVPRPSYHEALTLQQHWVLAYPS
jgi:hypothetical protein